MTIIQLEIQHVNNAAAANNWLRQYKQLYPKREIINVNMCSAEPAGWFMTIVYKVEI